MNIDCAAMQFPSNLSFIEYVLKLLFTLFKEQEQSKVNLKTD